MAKGKRSTALFDVMYNTRKPAPSAPPGGFAMPKWWGKRATKTELRPDSPPALPTAPPPAAVEYSQPALPAVERTEEPVESQPTMRIVADEPVAVDPIEREVRFKLSYGGAIAAGFVLLLILVIAYLAGSRSQPSDTSMLTPKHSQNVANSTANGSGLLAAVTSDPPAEQPAPVGHIAVVPTPPAITPVATAKDTTLHRQVGMHYVIAQTFPKQDMAEKACDFLNKAGIQCTVIKGLMVWASPNWYSVVGVRPFDHIQNNQDLQAYKDAITTAGEQFAGKNIFNQFEPREYKWRLQADQVTNDQ